MLRSQLYFYIEIVIFFRNGSYSNWNAAILWSSMGHVSSQFDTATKFTAASEATIDTITASWRKSTSLSGLYAKRITFCFIHSTFHSHATVDRSVYLQVKKKKYFQQIVCSFSFRFIIRKNGCKIHNIENM